MKQSSHDPEERRRQTRSRETRWIRSLSSFAAYILLPKIKSMQDPDDDFQAIPTLRISDDLTRAAGVLQDMQTQGELLGDRLSNSPPALFGAGGPM